MGQSQVSSFDSVKATLAAKPASMVFTVGAENTNVRNVTIQLLDGNGGAMTRKCWVDLVLWATSGKAALSSASTGLAVDTGTISIAAPTAGKVMKVLSDATGKVALTYTDTGTATAVVEAQAEGLNAESAQFANT